MSVPDNLLHYPELVIKKNIIAYDDLQIQGNFGRDLRLPGDAIPVLSTLTAQGKVNPKLLTCKNQEPALDVYVVNQASSGGGSPAATSVGGFGTYAVAHNAASSISNTQVGNVLYGIALGAWFDTGQAPGPAVLHFNILGQAPDNLHLGTLIIGMTGGPNSAFSNDWFPGGIDISRLTRGLYVTNNSVGGGGGAACTISIILKYV